MQTISHEMQIIWDRVAQEKIGPSSRVAAAKSGGVYPIGGDQPII